MATPNYGFEKRQRELAKKQKKEEKLRAKAARKAHGGADEPDQDEPRDDDPSAGEGVESGGPAD